MAWFRTTVIALSGLALLLLSLSGVVLLARHVRPLVHRQSTSQETLPALIEKLRSAAVFEERVAAGRAIIAGGTETLVEALGAVCQIDAPDAQPVVVPQALQALATAASDSAAALGEGLFSDKANVRIAAAMVLRQMGPKARPALGALAKALSDENRWVRWSAAEAIGSVGPDAAVVVDTMLPLLDHEDRFTRRRVAAALGRIGPGASRAASRLAKAQKDDHDPAVRKAAEAALYLVNLEEMATVAAAEAGPEIQKLVADLKQDDEYTSAAAANKLRDLGPQAKQAVPALALALRSKHKWVRVAAAEALAAIGPDAQPVLPCLEQADGEDDAERRDAVEAARVKNEGHRLRN
jgi:HEAT repeat protein